MNASTLSHLHQNSSNTVRVIRRRKIQRKKKSIQMKEARFTHFLEQSPPNSGVVLSRSVRYFLFFCNVPSSFFSPSFVFFLRCICSGSVLEWLSSATESEKRPTKHGRTLSKKGEHLLPSRLFLSFRAKPVSQTNFPTPVSSATEASTSSAADAAPATGAASFL